MADRGLTYSEVTSLLEAHGCRVSFHRKSQVLKAVRGDGLDAPRWSQHLHKGKRDSLGRLVVARMRRRLGFHQMSDEDFYRPLD